MDCTVVYGLGRNIKHRAIMPVTEAFRKLPRLRMTWLFVDIYYNDRLVYTTQGCAGVRFICDGCPYKTND